jgi:hypothetical protein
MDMAGDFDFWEKELPVINGAPHLFWGGIIATIVLTVPIIWFVINWGYRRQIATAAEKLELADRAKGEVERQFNAYKEEASAGADYGVLVERMAKVEAAIGELSTANNAVRSAIGISVGTSTATGISDSFANTLALQAEADKEQPK